MDAAAAAALVVTAAITYAVCGSPVGRAVTAAADTAAKAQALYHIGKMYFRFTQFAIERQLVKNIGRIH